MTVNLFIRFLLEMTVIGVCGMWGNTFLPYFYRQFMQNCGGHLRFPVIPAAPAGRCFPSRDG